MEPKIADIVKKDIADMKIAGFRFTARPEEIGDGFTKVGQACGNAANGPSFALYYSMPDEFGKVDMEACMPVSKDVETEEVKTRVLSGGKMVSTIHYGSYETIGNTYNHLLSYLQENGLVPIGAFREIYLECMLTHGDDTEKYVTEIQVPIR
jgi:effector-binding domain-containing protein